MRASRAAVLGAVWLVLACAGEPEGEDLLASLPHAQVYRADGELLFAERSSRRGWGLTEQDAAGRFRWALGGEAEVEFFALADGGAMLAAEARGAIPAGAATQPARVRLNGTEVARLELAVDWADYEVALAPPALRRGLNRLTFEFDRPLAPEASAPDARPLAACFRSLVVGSARPLPKNRLPLVLDLGSTEVTGVLGEGWSDPTGDDAADPGWRWAPAPRARLRLDLPTPADRRVHLTARRPEQLEAQRLDVWLNGHQLGGHELSTDWSTLTVEAPREEWQTGSNELILRLGTVFVAEGASHSAGISRLEVETLGEPALALRRDGEGARVRQPGGTSVDLFRWVPQRRARLLLAATGRGDSPARVVVDVEPDGGQTAEAWRGELGTGKAREIDLSRWAGELVRLRLSVPGGGISWHQLELRGDGASSPAADPPEVAVPTGEVPSRPNLLLYVIDTLRADHTSLYGYPRRTTPRLEALAAESIVFDPAWANASWTRPGTATLLTGTLPSVHGVINTLSLMSPEVELLSETLQDAGYSTHALVTNPNLRPGWETNRGWDEYRYFEMDLRFTDSSALLNREVIPRLAELAAAEKPFFLYLHSMDPHAPYHPPEGYREFLDPAYAGPVDGSMGAVGQLLERLRRDGAAEHAADLAQLHGLYDGGILHNDARIGELVEAMGREGLLDSTAILITSDHGEEFFEHGGVMHGHSLYQEQIRVPMLLRPPGGAAPRRIAGAQQVDVAVMLTALAGVTPAPTAIGRDLVRLGDAVDRPVFAEEELRDRRLWAFVEDGMKLHYNRNPLHAEWQRQETHELFDLVADAEERHNLFSSRPVVAGYLRERARALAAGLSAGAAHGMLEPEELSDELRGQLQALGYLQ